MAADNLNLTRIRALLIDDNPFARELANAALSALNVRDIHRANDGETGLELAEQFKPDLILVDWFMEPVNGLEFIRMVRTHENRSIRFTPIIMVTAYAELWRVHDVRDAGANEFVVKPFSATTLYNKIRTIIDHPRPFIEAPNSYFGPDRRRRTVPVEVDHRSGRPLAVGV